MATRHALWFALLVGSASPSSPPGELDGLSVVVDVYENEQWILPRVRWGASTNHPHWSYHDGSPAVSPDEARARSRSRAPSSSESLA